MIIAFCGHSDFNKNEKVRSQCYLKSLAEHNKIDFYHGNYGSFDFFAESCCLTIKSLYPHVKLIFVTPYQDEIYLKSKTIYHSFDEIIYPEIERVPKKYAINFRNKYMIDNTDIVVAYVNNHISSNSFKMIEYAKSKGKTIVNFAERIY